MPNWCSNRFQCWGDDITSFTEKFKKDDKGDIEFSFNAHHPMPESLHIKSSSKVDTGIAIINYRNGNDSELNKIMDYEWVKREKINSFDELIASLLKEESEEEYTKEARIALDNIKKYGYKDWYDWSVANWSTKWDACESDIEEFSNEFLAINFETAWAPPEGWFRKICTDYPNLQFELKYDEPGMGFFGRMRSTGNGNYHDRCIDD